jgi:hypothetical protein
MSKDVPTTDFQLFVLAYLYTQELFKYDIGLTHHPQYRDTPYRMSITQLTIISPPSVTPTTEAKVKEDLILLIRDNKIKVSNRMHDKGFSIDTANLSEEDTFTITTDGRLFIKHYLADGLSRISSNKEEYQKAVREQGFSDEIKKYFNGLWEKLKDRSQDQAVDLILVTARNSKTYLPTLILLIIKFFNPELDSGLDQPVS